MRRARAALLYHRPRVGLRQAGSGNEGGRDARLDHPDRDHPAIAGGAYIFRDRISGGAGDLKVGDCFDEPKGLTANAEVKDVQHHPCNESHTGEVVFVGDLTGTGSTYPSDTQFTDFILSKCVPAFNTYTGKDFETDQVLDLGSFLPTPDGWKSGDHEVTCYVIRLDGAAVTTSVKVAP